MSASTQPLVTVLIATYNRGEAIRYTLESLIGQDFDDFEAWIIGDACSDNTGAVVSSFDDTRLNWHNMEFNSGSQGSPNNEGIRRARGKYIAYLGHDDLWFPWHLSSLVECIDSTHSDVVYGMCPMIGEDGVNLVLGRPPGGVQMSEHFIPPSTILHVQTLTADIGPWADHTKIDIAPDHELIQRAYGAGKSVQYSEQLGVLKFTSYEWKAYAQGRAVPQESYLEMIQNNPRALEREILLRLSTFHAEVKTQLSAREAIRELVRALIRWVQDIYGRDRWPLSTWRLRRHRKKRAIFRQKRGLGPYNRQGD